MQYLDKIKGMSCEYLLSRLDFLGLQEGERLIDIEAIIPNLVIQEIASAHGCNGEIRERSSLLHLIQVTPIKKVKEPFDRQDWRYVARYVNPGVSTWREASKLKLAFNFLWGLRECNLDELGINFEVGLQKPSCLYSLNACVLFGICYRYKLLTWPEMSYVDLAFAVKTLLLPRGFLIGQLTNYLQRSSREVVAKTFLSLFQSCHQNIDVSSPEPITYHELECIHQVISSPLFLQDRFIPTQPGEVVGLVAQRYKLDISSSRYPFDELARLREVKEFSQYQPVDPIMAEYYICNPLLYSLEEHFNPFFPEKYYTNTILDKLLTQSGINLDRSISRYSQLVEVYLCNNFYHGFRPNILNGESPFLYEPRDELNSNYVLCYGNPVDGFTFFTYQEVADFLRHHKAFLHPYSSVSNTIHLRPEEIRRLTYLTEERSYPYDEPEAIEARQYLGQTLLYIEAFNGHTDTIIASFIQAYNQEVNEVKIGVNHGLKLLFELAMYMRGWKGPEEGEDTYPVEFAPEKNPGKVFPRVTEAMASWENHLQTLGHEWALRLKNLPLVKYEEGFIVSNDPNIGQTIGQKIAIVRQGEDINNVVGTCIRISSGWLAASAYRYMMLIGLKPPIQINKLAYIS